LSDLGDRLHVAGCEVKEFFWHFRLLHHVVCFRNSRPAGLSQEIAREILFVADIVFEIVPGRDICFTIVAVFNFKIVAGLNLRMVLFFILI
jgi:hypothetical protein